MIVYGLKVFHLKFKTVLKLNRNVTKSLNLNHTKRPSLMMVALLMTTKKRQRPRKTLRRKPKTMPRTMKGNRNLRKLEWFLIFIYLFPLLSKMNLRE